MGPLIFFLSLLLMAWGGLRLIVTVFLRVAIIITYHGCGVWVLMAFWGTLFQLGVSPFNWIDGVMEDMARRVNRMLDNKAACVPDGEETKHSLENLRKKYLWWLSSREGEESATSPGKAESGDTVTLFEGRNTCK